MQRCCLPALCLILLSAGCGSALKPISSQEARSYQSILEWTQRNGMPGAVLLIDTPTTHFLGSVGHADAERKVPMRPDHAFRVGSITKTFLNLVAAQLQAEGRLDPDQAMARYLPASITAPIAYGDQITVRQLIRHRSGIHGYDQDFWYALQRWGLDRRGDWPPLRSLAYAHHTRPRFLPGQGFEYSNPNAVLLGLIVDGIAGHPHSTEIRRRILDPLRLTHTYYERSEPARGELAHGYEWPLGLRVDTLDWTPVADGSAGLVSTAEDLAVFIRSTVRAGDFLNEATRKVLKNITDPTLPATANDPGPLSRYDFGLEAIRTNTETPWFFGHRGVSAGYLCMAWHEPQHDITIVFCGTSAHLQAVHPLQVTYEFYHRLESALFALTVAETTGKQAWIETTPRRDSDLQGVWHGSLGPWFWPWPLHVSVRIAEPVSGTFHTELDNVDQGPFGQPVAVDYDRPTVKLTVKSGAGMFVGKLNRNHTKMSGQWVQNGHAIRLVLTRDTRQAGCKTQVTHSAEKTKKPGAAESVAMCGGAKL